MTAPAFTVFIATTLVNPLNGRGKSEHWGQRARRAKTQREAVAFTIWSALRDPQRGSGMIQWRITAKPETPKRVTFVAHVSRRFDSDGLQAALKSVRDGLQDCGLIHDDGPDSGHTFTYTQVTGRPYGVTITVAVA